MSSSSARVFKIILAYINTLKRHHHLLTQKPSVHGVHHMRVTARRLRNTLSVLSDEHLQKFNKELKKMARALGAARDNDVQIEALKNFAREEKHSDCKKGLNQLIKLFKNQRLKLEPELQQSLKKIKKKQTLKNVEDYFKQLDISNDDLKDLVNHAIKKQIADLLAFSVYVHQPTKIAELHQMRIAGKHLRYTLETFKPLYAKQIQGYIDGVLEIHRTLGELHDYDVWIESLPKYFTSDESFNRSLKDLITKCKKLRAQTYRRFVGIWENLRRQNFFENLEKYVMPNAK